MMLQLTCKEIIIIMEIVIYDIDKHILEIIYYHNFLYHTIIEDIVFVKSVVSNKIVPILIYYHFSGAICAPVSNLCAWASRIAYEELLHDSIPSVRVKKSI